MYSSHDSSDTASRPSVASVWEQSAHAPAAPPPRPRRRRGGAVLAGMVLGALIAGGTVAGLWAAGAFDDSPADAVEAVSASVPAPTTSSTSTNAPDTVPPAPVVAPVPLAGSSQVNVYDASDVGMAVVPSVVTVQVGSQSADGLLAVASGSGVLLDEAGYIVTNDHVVDNGQAYEVVLSDGRVYAAELVGTDAGTDLAVLRIEAADLEPIVIGSTDGLLVGDPAIAIGSPLGLEGGPSLTVGVLSAFGREVQTGPNVRLYGMVQTDAPITQGSSGGALVDREGRLIGITTAVGVSNVGIEGIGFATPIEIVTRVVDELLESGGASQPFLGINGATAFSDRDDGGRAPVGVDVSGVEPLSAAEDAGLLAGDVISALDGRTIDTMDELISLLRRYSAGDELTMSIVRDGSTIVLEVTLGERP